MVDGHDLEAEQHGAAEKYPVAGLNAAEAALHAEHIQARHGDDHADPELSAALPAQKEAEHRHHHNVHGRQERGLGRGRVDGDADLLSRRGRKQEGAALQKKFTEKIQNIGDLLKSIEPYEQSRTERIRQRLVEALETIPNVEYDKNRLEQEMIYYIEKLDINEEKQRLANHLKYFMETMENGHGQGKKLGFIAQEMGREINTTGSKSNLAEMQNIVVKMKDELEQIKEQVLNVM